MAATYTVRMAALATDTSIKWIDNLLSHHALPGVAGGRQGLERAISMDGLIAIELVRVASGELGIPLARAVAIAGLIMSDRSRQSIRTDSGIELRFPLADLERRLRERLVEAVDAAPTPPRGRPRRP